MSSTILKADEASAKSSNAPRENPSKLQTQSDEYADDEDYEETGEEMNFQANVPERVEFPLEAAGVDQRLEQSLGHGSTMT